MTYTRPGACPCDPSWEESDVRAPASFQELVDALLDPETPVHDLDGDHVREIVGDDFDRAGYVRYKIGSEARSTDRTEWKRTLDFFRIPKDFLALPPVTEDDIQAAIASITGGGDA